MKKITATVIALFLITFSAAWAVPVDKEIYYKKSTTLAPKTYTMRFSLWDAETDGSMVWSEEKTINLTGTAIKTLLGDTATLDGVNFSQQLWVQVDKVKAGPVYKVIGTRDKLLPVPYAITETSPNGPTQTAYNNLLITNGTSQVAVQQSITIPTAGIVVAMSTGYVFHSHTNGAEDNTIITLDNASGTNPTNSIGTVEVRTPAQEPTAAYWAVPYSITRTFVESSAGAKTYYVNCRKSEGASGYCYGNHLTLLFFKNAY